MQIKQYFYCIIFLFLFATLLASCGGSGGSGSSGGSGGSGSPNQDGQCPEGKKTNPDGSDCLYTIKRAAPEFQKECTETAAISMQINDQQFECVTTKTNYIIDSVKVATKRMWPEIDEKRVEIFIHPSNLDGVQVTLKAENSANSCAVSSFNSASAGGWFAVDFSGGTGACIISFTQNGQEIKTHSVQVQYALSNVLDFKIADLSTRNRYFILKESLNLAAIAINGKLLPSFAGIFDGQGFTISGIRIDGNSNDSGFIGETSSFFDVTIKNVKLTITKLSGQNNVGGLVGSAQSIRSQLNITDVSVNFANGATINCQSYCGGLVGNAAGGGTFNNISVIGEVTVNNLNEKFGGVFGSIENRPILNNIKVDATATIMAPSEMESTPVKYIGLLAGQAKRVALKSAELTGKITLQQNAEYVGGMFGYSDDGQAFHIVSQLTLENSKDLELVRAGGLIGENNSTTLSRVYNTFDLNWQGDASVTGGLIGKVSGAELTAIISNADINVSKSVTSVGGLLGSASETNSVREVFITGSTNITAQTPQTGKLLGNLDMSSELRVSNSYTHFATDLFVGGVSTDSISNQTLTIENCYINEGKFVPDDVVSAKESWFINSYAPEAIASIETLTSLSTQSIESIGDKWTKTYDNKNYTYPMLLYPKTLDSRDIAFNIDEELWYTTQTGKNTENN